MRINSRIFGYRMRYPFLFFDYLLWLIFDFSKFKSINKKSIKKVVVIHTGAIGELVMITPIIKELKSQLNCKVDLMIKESMFDLFYGNPNVSKLIPYSPDMNLSVKRLKGENYNLAVIFQASFKNALICYKAGINYRIGGFSRIKRFPTFLYTRRSFPICLMHSLDYSFNIIEKIGIKKPSNPKPEVYVSKESEKILFKKLKARKYVLIHPGFGPIRGKSPPRVWENEKYAAIADYLYEKIGVNVVFSGLSDQKDLISSIISKCKFKNKMINFAGKTDMKEFCALVKNADLVIAPDTGASHIAASFSVPLVNLMDAPIIEWKPIGKKDKIVNLHHPREIAFFEKGFISTAGGVKTISLDEVKKAVDKLIR